MNDERSKGPFRFVAERLAEGGTSAFVAMFNHLLRQNDWARARLAMFAGRRVAIELEAPLLARHLAPPRLAARITDEGLLDTATAAPAGAPASAGASDAPGPALEAGAEAPGFDVEMHVRPSFAAAAALVREGTRGLAPYVRIEGEVMLAAALADVAERMRWDPEEDLSRITGDVVAHRVGRGAAAARDAMREFRDRFAGAAGRRFAGATGTLVGRDELESMRNALDSLEERVHALESKRRHLLAQMGERETRDVDPGVAPQLMPPLELPRLEVDPGVASREEAPRDAASGSPSGEADGKPGRGSESGASGSALG